MSDTWISHILKPIWIMILPMVTDVGERRYFGGELD